MSETTAAESSHVHIPFEERQSESIEERAGFDFNTLDWSDIKYDKASNTIKAALTTYTLGAGFLLEAVAIDRTNIIRNPILLNLQVDGSSINLPGTELTHVSQSDTHIGFTSSHALTNATITTDMHFADDGFLLVSVIVTPSKGEQVEIQSLSLEIPMADLPEYYLSKHASYDFTKQRFDKKSFFNSVKELDSDPTNFSFNPVVSIESKQYGIEWMTETNAWHSLVDPSKAVIIEPKKEGLDFIINFVTMPLKVNDTVSYQFSLFPIPSRNPPKFRNTKFFASAGSAEKFSKNFSNFQVMKPVYFANWSRMKFAQPGLPVLSENIDHQDEIDSELNTLSSNGLGYMPYTSMHLLATNIPELKENVTEWRSDDSRRGNWRGLTGKRLTVQPIAFSNPSLTEFMLSKHLEALEQTNIDVMYHDVAAMNRLKYTQERAIKKYELPQGSVYAPFFGQRDYLRRYRNLIKNASPSTDIALHTGAILPRSIATHTDYLVFGEPFHSLFKSNADSSNIDYDPNYFSIPSAMLNGPYKQKNGFTYVLIPQLKRAVDNIDPDKETLDRQTDSLLTFSAYHEYPVWGTKLSARKFKAYQRIQDLFLKNASKVITYKFTDPAILDNSRNIFGVYSFDEQRSMLMLSNETDHDYSFKKNLDILPEEVRAQIIQEYGDSIVVRSKDSMLLTFEK